MTAQGHHKLVGTADIERKVMVDTLIVPFVNATTIGVLVGTILPWVVSVSIAGTALTIQFKDDFNFKPGSVLIPKATVENGAAKWDAAIQAWDGTLKRLTLNTYNAAGALTAPPALAAIHLLLILRY